ncbi:MAG TPA: cytochrome c [Bryobacteraceae bacterium]|jgi:mono/diheme cytochrome c family protein|nr:cytochrome c [Bryobacteraceae bacterium]
MNKASYLLTSVLACVGCRQDMQIQPKYPPLVPSSFFADGRSARPIPEDTIAVDNAMLLSEKTTTDNAFLTTIPLPITRELLERGRDRFDIYCAPCHGRSGSGEGRIASRGFLKPADLNSNRVRNAPAGYLYEVIVNGYGAMDEYAYQIKNARDRWAIVAYIRALELSRRATLDDVPPQERSQLEAQP